MKETSSINTDLLLPYFKEYEEIANLADNTFTKVDTKYKNNVQCKIGCSDCCYALFDIGLIEALYINHKFNIKVKIKDKKAYLEKANKIDRKIYQIKREAFKEYKEVEDKKVYTEIFGQISSQKISCPFLNHRNMCDFYEFRPITCRLYGIPTSICGVGHTCGLSGFEKGKKYETVKLEIIQDKLFKLSKKFTEDIKSKQKTLSEMYVPLSNAILCEFNNEFLGI